MINRRTFLTGVSLAFTPTDVGWYRIINSNAGNQIGGTLDLSMENDESYLSIAEQFTGVQTVGEWPKQILQLRFAPETSSIRVDTIPVKAPMFAVTPGNRESGARCLNWMAGNILRLHPERIELTDATSIHNARCSIAGETHRGVGNVLLGNGRGFDSLHKSVGTEFWTEWHKGGGRVVRVENNEPFVLIGYDGHYDPRRQVLSTSCDAGCILAVEAPKVTKLSGRNFVCVWFVETEISRSYWRRLV